MGFLHKGTPDCLRLPHHGYRAGRTQLPSSKEEAHEGNQSECQSSVAETRTPDPPLLSSMSRPRGKQAIAPRSSEQPSPDDAERNTKGPHNAILFLSLCTLSVPMNNARQSWPDTLLLRIDAREQCQLFSQILRACNFQTGRSSCHVE